MSLFKSSKSKILFIFCAIILAAYFGWGLWTKDSAAILGLYDNEPAYSGNTDQVAGMLAEKNAVVASEQKPDRNITVAQAYLEAPGYVVIHEDNGGKPGKILGSSALLTTWQNEKVNITISRSAVAGEQLYAMLHSEKDGNSVFNAAVDTPVMSSVLPGPIMGWFEIKADADESIEISI